MHSILHGRGHLRFGPGDKSARGAQEDHSAVCLLNQMNRKAMQQKKTALKILKRHVLGSSMLYLPRGQKPYKSTHAGPCSCKVGDAVSTCTAVGLSWRGTVPKQESRMAERSRWWIERWLRSPLFLSLSLSFSLSFSFSLSLSFSLFLSLSLIYLSVYLAI